MGVLITAEKRIADYRTWREKIRQCSDCELHQFRTQVVVDSGTPGARAAIIGEAPGASEDAAGEAFVGASGKLLRGLCEKAELSVNEDLIFFNVLMCRPPNNVFPKPEVVKKCQPHTKTKMDLLQPEIAVLVGRQASKWVLFPERDIKMGDVLGKTFHHIEYPGTKYFICIYHPAYLMRQDTETRKKLENETIKLLQIVKKDLTSLTIPVRGELISTNRQVKTSLF